MAPVRLPVGRKTTLSSRYGSHVGFVDRKWMQIRRSATSCQTGNGLSDDGKRAREVVAQVVDETESEENDDDDEDDVDDEESSLDDDEDSNRVSRGGCLANGSCCSIERQRSASKSGSSCRSPRCLTGRRGLQPTLDRRLLRYFTLRRRSKFTVFVSLSLCVTAIKLLTTNVDFRLPPGANTIADASSLSADREEDDAYRHLLAEPDCQALIAGDQRQLTLTKAMLFREVRPAMLPSDERDEDCSVSLLRRFGFNSTPTVAVASHRSPTRSIAYLVGVDSGSTLETTVTLLASLYNPANYVCVAIGNSSRSRDVLVAALQIAKCLNNVIVVQDDDHKAPDVTCRRCVSGFRCGACSSQSRPEAVDTGGGNDTESTDRKCAREMLSVGRSEWDYLVKLSTFHLPVDTDEDVVEFLRRRLTLQSRARNGTQARRNRRRCASNLLADIGSSLRFANGCAYSRRTVEHLMEKKSRLSNVSVSPLQNDSLGGATSANIAGDRENQLEAVEISTDKRCEYAEASPSVTASDSSFRSPCVYTVADLPGLTRVRTPFVHPFDVNIDHFAVRCVLDRRRARSRTKRIS